MAPSNRRDARRGAHRAKLVTPTKFVAEYPTYSGGPFTTDILLADQPVVGRPSLEMLHHHRYITLRVGPSLAVHYINSEMLFNKSTYGKELLSRMYNIPKAWSFRVDYPEEEEEPFLNLIEWVNYGRHTLYKDTFRGSFLRHLKLYLLALKYGVEALAQDTFEVITDMFVESHPEQMTRAPFWSAVVNLVYGHTGIGDDMRSVITGYTLWYSLNGRAKHFRTKSNTVKGALLALITLPSTSPFYRIDCSILHENPYFFEEKLDGFFGSTRCASPAKTVWWKDAIEDPLFQVWMTHWKMVGGQQESLIFQDEDIYVGDATMIKGVDDEDERFLESYGGKGVGLANANGVFSKDVGSKGMKKKSRGKPKRRANITKLRGIDTVKPLI
ncbi:hypothetical protein Q9L58_007260 [Maublancomyces gigas]|uniref:Aminotransferase-like plant mobile domain-containing protein n=1 Tax=Discina gigas TaxID=1032678 RepID=A0ABR3GDA1_9PEZI